MQSSTHYKSSTIITASEQIADLSRLAPKLLAYEDISDDLTVEEEAKITEYVKQCFKLSYDRISKRYDHWREADRAHDVYVPAEATSFREKAVISDTRAITDTVITYLMAAITGRNPMFQLEGLNSRSRRVTPIMERLLHQQMRRTAGEARLAQHMLDSARYGCAPTKILWDDPQKTNQIVNFNPYRYFPDPRVNWTETDLMQFIGFSMPTSYSAMVRTGLYPKITKYPALRTSKIAAQSSWECNRHAQEEGRGLSLDPTKTEQGYDSFRLGPARLLNELWLTVQGYELNLPQIESLWLLITVLDEEVVVRFQLNPYGRHYPLATGSLYHDCHKTFGQSLYDVLLPLHDIATWLLRSRVDNVQAALNNLIFADPTQVNIPDLIDRNPWGVVRTLPGTKPGDGVYIAQIPDVTRTHWNDIAAMSDLKQRVSAASDAQQGMPTADVRTATEIARLTQLGSQRLGIISKVMSATTIRPMVRMMVGNIQDTLMYEGSIRIDPFQAPGILTDVIKNDYVDFTIQDLQGDIDYMVVDGTLPIEPTRNADTWLNMLQIMKMTGLDMEYKSGRIAEEAIRAMGVSDLQQFRISAEERAQGLSPSQQASQLERTRGQTVLPQETVNSQLQAGNIIPAGAQ